MYGFMAVLPLIIYLAITIAIIIVYQKKRRQKDEEYFKPINKINDTSEIGFEDQRQAFPQLKQKVGYVAPIVWLVIGAALTPWIFGLCIVAISLVVLSSRIKFNKRVDLWNTQIMTEYGK
jgi:predicted histidine transporter YuiF (NhaC family)